MTVIGVANAKWKEHIWFSKLVQYLQMDAKTVRKSIKRCMDKNWLEEYKLVHNTKTWQGRNHKVFSKGYRFSKKFIKDGKKFLKKK